MLIGGKFMKIKKITAMLIAIAATASMMTACGSKTSESSSNGKAIRNYNG